MKDDRTWKRTYWHSTTRVQKKLGFLLSWQVQDHRPIVGVALPMKTVVAENEKMTGPDETPPDYARKKLMPEASAARDGGKSFQRGSIPTLYEEPFRLQGRFPDHDPGRSFR